MALISVVQKQVVEKDKRIENETLLEGISLASVLPGPIAFNVVTFVGYKLKGFRGALVSMAGILLPSFLMMLLLSFLYIKFGNVPSFSHFFAGVLPAVAAIIASVALGMAKKNINDAPQIMIAVASAVIIALSKVYIATLAIMLTSAVIGYLIYYKPSGITQNEISVKNINKESRKISYTLSLLFILIIALILVFPSVLPKDCKHIALINQKLMVAFSGMSLSLFGGGYVVIPAMQQVVVNSMNLLSNREFADAIAMGQITPGPIFISATFIGYKVAGFWGALNATISIFLPPGLVMIVCTRFFDKIRNSAVILSIFKGLRPAIIGMIAAAAFTIINSNEISVKSGLLLCIFMLLSIRYKADPVFLIPVAGIIGLLIF